VPAVVNSGDLPISLLGMSYLSRFEDVRIKGDWMLLNR
jgi:predicted aspartyl protease